MHVSYPPSLFFFAPLNFSNNPPCSNHSYYSHLNLHKNFVAFRFENGPRISRYRMPRPTRNNRKLPLNQKHNADDPIMENRDSFGPPHAVTGTVPKKNKKQVTRQNKRPPKFCLRYRILQTIPRKNPPMLALLNHPPPRQLQQTNPGTHRPTPRLRNF